MESEVQEKVATALTPELKQAYVDAIRILFNGVLTATPDQINERVIADVDKMLKEIATCSKALANLGFDLVYDLILDKKVEEGLKTVIENFLVRYFTLNKVKDIIQDWVLKMVSDVRFKICLDSARVNWKSRIAEDLLDL